MEITKYNQKRNILNSGLKLTVYESLIKNKDFSKKELYFYSIVLSSIKLLRRNNLAKQSIQTSLIYEQLQKIGYTRPKREFESIMLSLVAKGFIKSNKIFITLSKDTNNLLNGQAKDYLPVKFRLFSKILIEFMYSKELALKADRKTIADGIISYTNQTKVAEAVGCSRQCVTDSVKNKDILYIYKVVGSFKSKSQAIEFKLVIRQTESGQYCIVKASSGNYTVLRLDGSKKLSGGSYFVKQGKRIKNNKCFQGSNQLRDKFSHKISHSGNTTTEAYDYRNDTTYLYSNTLIRIDQL